MLAAGLVSSGAHFGVKELKSLNLHLAIIGPSAKRMPEVLTLVCSSFATRVEVLILV